MLSKMTQINAYLTFNGNCREAMSFYKECLGGVLQMQTVGDSPLAEHMPPHMREAVLHAELKHNQMVLMGSDMCSDNGLIKGNAISMAIDCSTEAEANICYQKLATGGISNHPLQQTHWGAIFGDLTDKYGNHWLINHKKINNVKK
jgi:PhnB protein